MANNVPPTAGPSLRTDATYIGRIKTKGWNIHVGTKLRVITLANALFLLIYSIPLYKSFNTEVFLGTGLFP